jgi:hypothetical protein
MSELIFCELAANRLGWAIYFRKGSGVAQSGQKVARKPVQQLFFINLRRAFCLPSPTDRPTLGRRSPVFGHQIDIPEDHDLTIWESILSETE